MTETIFDTQLKASLYDGCVSETEKEEIVRLELRAYLELF